jgi:hypothetical protein
MNTLQSQQLVWELTREHQAEILRHSQREQLANMAQQPKSNWLSNLFRRETRNSTFVINTNATPEIG